jgi:hypothetical protein
VKRPNQKEHSLSIRKVKVTNKRQPLVIYSDSD